VSAFAAGMLLAGVLVLIGGLISLVGIVNPPREREPEEHEELGAVRLAHPCPEGGHPRQTLDAPPSMSP
jgi:hypothetical protein